MTCNLTTMKIWKGILFWKASFLTEWIDIGWSDWINWNALPLPIERQTLWPPNISNFTNIAPKKILHYREIHLDGVTITLNQTFQTVPSRTPKTTHSTRWNTIEQIFWQFDIFIVSIKYQPRVVAWALPPSPLLVHLKSHPLPSLHWLVAPPTVTNIVG